MSTARPTKPLLSQGLAKVGPSGLFVQRLEHKQAASLAQSGCLLSRPPSAAPPRRVEEGGQRGWTAAPARCVGVSLLESFRGASATLGKGRRRRAAAPQLVALAGLSLLAMLGQEVPAGEKAPRRGFAH